jgi:hypothetical protein
MNLPFLLSIYSIFSSTLIISAMFHAWAIQPLAVFGGVGLKISDM